MRKLVWLLTAILILSLAICIGCAGLTEKPIKEVPWTGEDPVTPPEPGTKWVFPEESSPAPEPLHPEPEPAPIEVPLNYEVVDSFVEEDTFKTRAIIKIGDVVVQDEIIETTYPIGNVTLKNTDDVPGEFTVLFTFYELAVFREIDGRLLECLTEIPGEEGEEHDGFITLRTDEYNKEAVLNLEPGEEDTATFKNSNINIDEDYWSWEFEITPSTKIE